MTKISEKDIQGLFPTLKGAIGIDPTLAHRLDSVVRRIYELLLFKITETKKQIDKEVDSKLEDQKLQINKLMGTLSQPLTGSSVTDTVLEAIATTPIKQSDLPSDLAATRLNAGGTILPISALIEGEYLRRLGNLITGGMPVGTTTLAGGTLPDVEGILYTTPADHRTKIRNVLLFNNSAGALVADVLAKDPLNNIIYSDTQNINSLQKIILTPNIILPVNYTFRGFTSAEGAIEFDIFGIEETL